MATLNEQMREQYPYTDLVVSPDVSAQIARDGQFAGMTFLLGWEIATDERLPEGMCLPVSERAVAAHERVKAKRRR